MNSEVSTAPNQDVDAIARRARLVLLGCSAWLWVLVILPMVELGLGGVAGITSAVAFPACVVVGVWIDALARGRTRWAMRRGAEALLFAAAPLALVAALERPDLAEREVLGPLHVSLVVLAVAAYLASVAWLASTHAARRPAQAHPLPPSARIVEPAWPRAVRAMLLGLVTLGAIGLLAIAPLLDGVAARTARHGASAETAALLAGVLGMTLGVTTLGAVVAPALRARSASDRIPTRGRGLVSIALAVLSVAAWVWLHRAG
ncbi:MAG: hypothetical protein K1X94_01775 [Sandaracinaceae bacterium]|nr:hypothetical protein [Sandaracinaceae bacterium]